MGRHWTFSQNTLDEMNAENRIRVVTSEYTDVFGEKQDEILEYLMSDKETIDSNWTDIPGYSSTTGFQTENSEKLLERVINTGTKGRDLVMDFFLGSGTTSAVCQKIGRKWLGVEMGEHCYSVVLPRIKKAIYFEKPKDSSDCNNIGFIKYYDLEQYEDVLRRVHYEDADLFNNPDQDPYHSYVFLRDLKMLKSVEPDVEEDKVRFHPERLYPDIDLAETLSHLRGKWIRRITADFVEFQDGERMSLTDPDWATLKPMVWWR
jgi:adenine-specific DNA-methyltransferase